MRSQLITAITQATSTLTQFAVTQELPWSQNGQPLYLKNKKKIYIDEPYQEQTTLISTLDGNDVFQNDLVCNVYVSMDAKQTPSQVNSLINQILGCKSTINVVNFGSESDYTVDKQEDTIVYNFEFRLNQATT